MGSADTWGPEVQVEKPAVEKAAVKTGCHERQGAADEEDEDTAFAAAFLGPS